MISTDIHCRKREMTTEVRHHDTSRLENGNFYVVDIRIDFKEGHIRYDLFMSLDQLKAMSHTLSTAVIKAEQRH